MRKSRTDLTPITPEDAFGRVLRERRLELGMTQAQLEEPGVIERSFISRLEAGHSQVCIRNIFYLAARLEMKPAELIERVDLLTKDNPPYQHKK